MVQQPASVTLRSRFLSGRRLLSKLAVALAMVLFCVTASVWQERMPPLEYGLAFVGWIFIAACVSGRAWSSSYISGRKNTTLQVQGPYSICRNPLYFFSFLGGLGVACVTETLTIPFIFAVVFLLYYRQVIGHEETMLSQIYGQQYSDYLASTNRFWPSWKSYNEPATYEVVAARYRKELMDVTWFITAGGLVELIEGLHRAGYLPVLWRTY